MPTYYSGIDLHKRTSYLVTVDEEGSMVKEANLKNHPASISAYFASMPGKHKAVARAIVAKELARIVYHVLSKQTDFNEKFKGVLLTRRKSLQWPLHASPTA